MGLLSFLKGLFGGVAVDSLSPEEMVEMLPTLESWSFVYAPGSKEEKVFQTMNAVSVRFAGLPVQVQREALLKGLRHEEDHVRRACAERLQHWQNSPRVTMSLLEALADPDARVRRCAATHFATVACCDTEEQLALLKSRLPDALSKESDKQARLFLTDAIRAFGE